MLQGTNHNITILLAKMTKLLLIPTRNPKELKCRKNGISKESCSKNKSILENSAKLDKQSKKSNYENLVVILYEIKTTGVKQSLNCKQIHSRRI
jgi:hypothetical protein